MKMTLADELLYTAINLHRSRHGAQVGSGTGFFWTIYLADAQEVTVIITNKHVVNGCDQISAICHQADGIGGPPNGAFVSCLINLSPDLLVMHPDSTVDLCAIVFGPTINDAVDKGTPLFLKNAEASHVPQDHDWAGFDSIEDVVMIGCPRGIYDEFNNFPIVRRGITATPLGKRYGGRDEFMIDMACFPGSSGSPVFMMSRGHFDRERQTFLLDGWRFFLLGVLYSGPVITNEGQVILSQQPRVEVAAMMHLGQVIRSTAVLQLEDEIVRRFGLKRVVTIEPKSV